MDIEELKKRIAEADESGHDATCVELLRAYLAVKPDSPRNLYRYADNLRGIGRLSDAESVLESLNLDEIPKQWRYLIPLRLAEVYRETGRWELAQRQYEAAAALSPGSTVPWIYWGAFLSRQGRVKEAVEILSKGLNASGDLDEVHLNLGNCARCLGDYATAKHHYKEALRITPTYAEAAEALDDVIEAARIMRDVSPTFVRRVDATDRP